MHASENFFINYYLLFSISFQNERFLFRKSALFVFIVRHIWWVREKPVVQALKKWNKAVFSMCPFSVMAVLVNAHRQRKESTKTVKWPIIFTFRPQVGVHTELNTRKVLTNCINLWHIRMHQNIDFKEMIDNCSRTKNYIKRLMLNEKIAHGSLHELIFTCLICMYFIVYQIGIFN